jgi:hypothetical protein
MPMHERFARNIGSDPWTRVHSGPDDRIEKRSGRAILLTPSTIEL